VPELSRGARGYILAIVAAAVAATCAALLQPPRDARQVLLCLVLAILAGLAQLFEVTTPHNKAYVTTLLFLGTAALLLPALPAAVVAALPFAVEQVRKPKPWFIQTFNASSHVLATLAAAITAQAVLHAAGTSTVRLDHLGGFAAAGVAASAVLLLINHATLVGVLYLARGVTPRESGLFGPEGLLTDSALLSLGVVVALLWDLSPGLTLFAIVPIALLQRALHFPALQQASRTDAKTGLFNPAYFREVSGAQLARAEREGEPMTVVVADLDLLREVNNAYGHLAGDLVLTGVADVLRAEVREYDVVARFGGEEFTILLTGANADEGGVIAERIRARMAAQRFTLATAAVPVQVTVSLGIASYPEHGRDLDALLHRADLAVYRAKVEGRNRVRRADPRDDLRAAPADAGATPGSPVARRLGRPGAATPAVPSTDLARTRWRGPASSHRSAPGDGAPPTAPRRRGR
jgi:diguanylate cyclase (GGDEF)-like protein